MKKTDIRPCLNDCLSGMSLSPARKREILLAAAKQKPRAPLRVPASALAVAAAAVLLLAGVVCLLRKPAPEDTVTADRCAPGVFDVWPEQAQEQLLAALAAGGTDVSGAPSADAEESSLADYLSKVCRALPDESLERALASVKGPLVTWSMSDKAWHSELMLERGEVADGDVFYLTPPVDRTQQVLPMADAFLAEAAGVSADAYRASAAYACVYPALSDAYWSVLYLDDASVPVYEVRLDASLALGSLVLAYRADALLPSAVLPTPEPTAESTQVPTVEPTETAVNADPSAPLITWTFAQQAEAYPDTYGVPQTGDISLKTAVALAQNALKTRCGLSDEYVGSLYAYAYLMVDDPAGRYYSISFFRDEAALDLTPYAVHIGVDGTVEKVYGTTNG
jgi:hypothetical protein